MDDASAAANSYGVITILVKKQIPIKTSVLQQHEKPRAVETILHPSQRGSLCLQTVIIANTCMVGTVIKVQNTATPLIVKTATQGRYLPSLSHRKISNLPKVTALGNARHSQAV